MEKAEYLYHCLISNNPFEFPTTGIGWLMIRVVNWDAITEFWPELYGAVRVMCPGYTFVLVEAVERSVQMLRTLRAGLFNAGHGWITVNPLSGHTTAQTIIETQAVPTRCLPPYDHEEGSGKPLTAPPSLRMSQKLVATMTAALHEPIRQGKAAGVIEVDSIKAMGASDKDAKLIMGHRYHRTKPYIDEFLTVTLATGYTINMWDVREYPEKYDGVRIIDPVIGSGLATIHRMKDGRPFIKGCGDGPLIYNLMSYMVPDDLGPSYPDRPDPDRDAVFTRFATAVTTGRMPRCYMQIPPTV